MRGILQLPAPGVEDAGATREVGADATLVWGEPFAGEGRGVAHGLGGEALMGAEKGAQGVRDGAGEEDGRPRQVFCQVVLGNCFSRWCSSHCWVVGCWHWGQWR
jgi:hypothetical protein